MVMIILIRSGSEINGSNEGTSGMKILLVEDDQPTGMALVEALTAQHYTVNIATDGKTGLTLAEAVDYDLVLLDVLISEIDGISVCRHLRSQGDRTLILLLTAKDTSTDRVLGLDAGADDYVVKPFDLAELLARIRALLRRSTANPAPLITWENLQFDRRTGEIHYGASPLKLTPKEHGILELFLVNPHQIFSRSVMLDRLWDITEAPNEETITTHIKALRQKLKAAGARKDLIESVYGLGYRLKPLDRAPEPQNQSRALAPALGELAEVSRPSLPKLSTQPDVSATQQQMDAAMVELWEKFKDSFIAQVTGLAAVIPALAIGTLPPEQLQQAQQDVHKLKGSLGIFGHPQGSALALAIEPLLKLAQPLLPEQIAQLTQEVQALQQEVQQPPRASASIGAVPKPLILVLAAPAVTEQLPPDWRWEVALDWEAAQAALQRTRPDLVLLDFAQFATRDLAWAALQDVTAQAVPVIVLMATASLADRVQVRRLGGRAGLLPSIAADQLWQTIAQVLQPVSMSPGRVLIVDDDPAMLMAVSSLLEPWGVAVTPLAEPQRFWEVLEATAPDLLVLDIEMPTFSGIELCQAVRHDPRWGDRPILFLTAHTDIEQIYQAFAAGADDYIRKPIVAPELITRIMSRLDRQRLQLCPLGKLQKG